MNKKPENVFFEGFEDTSSLELTHAVGTLTFRFGEVGSRYFDVDLGLGAYLASDMYIDCSAIPSCFDAEADVTTLGGFAGISATLWRGLVVAARVHHADFGTIETIGPESGDLSGPMFSAYIGWEWGTWFR